MLLKALLLLAIGGSIASLDISANGRDYSFPVFSTLNWNLTTSVLVPAPVKLVHIRNHAGVWDMCKHTSFTKEGLKPLLDSYNVTAGDNWVALVNLFVFACPFDGEQPLNLFPKYRTRDVYLPAEAAFVFQKLGL